MQVPRYDAPQVQTTPLPTPRMSGDSPVAQAIGGLGQTLGNISQDALHLAGELKVQADQTFTEGVTADFLKAKNELGFQFRALKGAEALKQLPQYQTEYTKLKSDFDRKLNNPAQKRMFAHFTKNHDVEFDEELHRHTFEQGQLLSKANKQAMVDSTEQDLSLKYRDDNAYRRFDDKGNLLDSPINRFLAMVKTQLYDKGFNDGDPAMLQGLQSALGRVYVDRIDQLKLENPKAAFDFMNRPDVLPVIPAGDREKLGHQLKTITDTYDVDGILNQVLTKFKDADPDKEVSPDEMYAEVKKLTTDPHKRDLAYKEIEREVRVRNQGVQRRFQQLSGGVYMDAHAHWDKKEEVPVQAVRKDPRFLALPQDEQVKVLDKVEAENWKIHEHKEKMASEERTRRSQERRQAKEEETRRSKERRERWDSTYNYYANHPEELAQMDQDAFGALAGEVSHADYKRLVEQRKKLTSPQALSHAVIEAQTLNELLGKAGITKPDEVKTYATMARHYAAVAQKDAKHVLSPEEMKTAILQGLQHVAINVRTSRLGFSTGNETEVKRRMEVKNPAAIIIPKEVNARFDALEKLRGKRLSPERRRMLYDELLREKAEQEAR